MLIYKILKAFRYLSCITLNENKNIGIIQDIDFIH